MECCICLNKLNGKKKFKLSCDHEIHLNCYLSLVYANGMNIFFKCPLCREVNDKNLYKTEYHDLKCIINCGRCICTTKSGRRCKNKALLLNNGMCNIHNKYILPKEKYDLMCNYILWLFETAGTFRTKYLMIDIAKRICIKYNVESIHEICHYFYYFWHKYDRLAILTHKEKLYEFIDIELPPDNMIKMLDLSERKGKLII